jgi:hypothetical protein
MTREELYQLVWTKPMIQLAKGYGLSDVGLRKICIKQGIPTPPLGYWAKRQHGKKVIQPRLPPLKKGQSENIDLHVRPQPVLPPEILETRQAAERELNQPENKIAVPTERPAKIHPIAMACEKALRKAKPNHEGFVACGGAGKIKIEIGQASIDRVVMLIHSMLTAATQRGYQLSSAESEIWIVVDEQPLAVRIHETKNKMAHVPTPEDLKRQAKEDEWRSGFKVDYRSNRKVYPAWDYSPSGRLALEVSDPKQVQWRANPVVGRWRDRSVKRLEEYLSEVMAALKVGSSYGKGSPNHTRMNIATSRGTLKAALESMAGALRNLT